MPLINKDESSYYGHKCLCGRGFNNEAQWYAHVGECPIDRCASCLRVLGPGYDDPETHECPAIRLIKIEQELRKSTR